MTNSYTDQEIAEMDANEEVFNTITQLCTLGDYVHGVGKHNFESLTDVFEIKVKFKGMLFAAQEKLKGEGVAPFGAAAHDGIGNDFAKAWLASPAGENATIRAAMERAYK